MKGRKESIEFFTYTTTVSASGFVSEDVPVSYWVTRAEVEPLKETVKTEAYKTELSGGYTLIMRYRKDKEVTQSMTVTYKGGSYAVRSVENIEDKELRVVVSG